MPFGLDIRSNRGLISVSDVFGLVLIDSRTLSFSSNDNQGSFTVPLGDYQSFNNGNSYRVFCMATANINVHPSLRTGNSITTTCSFPATIGSNSNVTVNYRGGTANAYLFETWIVEM